ncbi:hypothetical protein Avbf_16491 [Armadillidium vulgare]|nr:hypothetical protein Avbf_16491 [Armadillidium vulgare]
MRLHTSEVRWSLKRTVALSEVLCLMSKSTNRNYESLLIPDNDIYSLGPNGPMVDGIHPSNEFIDALWRLLHNYDVFGERNPRESFTTVTTNLDETPRRQNDTSRARISGDYRQNKHDLRSKLSHSSPSPSLGVTESLPSTSSGNASNIHNDQFNAYSQYLSKKRPASSSYILSSKRLQMSIPLPRPIQRMTLEQIGLIQGQFNIFAAYMMGITHGYMYLGLIDSINRKYLRHIFVECSYHAIIELIFIRNYKFMHILIVLGPGSEFRVPSSESEFRVPSSGLRTLFHG